MKIITETDLGSNLEVKDTKVQVKMSDGVSNEDLPVSQKQVRTQLKDDLNSLIEDVIEDILEDGISDMLELGTSQFKDTENELSNSTELIPTSKAVKDGLDSYLPLSGDTLTGKLTQNQDSLIKSDLEVLGETNLQNTNTNDLIVNGNTNLKNTSTDDLEVKGTSVNKDNSIFEQNVTVQGDLTVLGTKTTITTEELTVEQNVITVNEGENGPGVSYGTQGLVVDRGTEENFNILYNESNKQLEIGTQSDTRAVQNYSNLSNGYIVNFDLNNNKLTSYVPKSSTGNSSVDVMSQKAVSEQLDTKLTSSNNLSELTNKQTQRNNLGLGNQATGDVGSSNGNLMQVGQFGLGSNSQSLTSDLDQTGWYYSAVNSDASVYGGGNFVFQTRYNLTSGGFRISNRSYSDDFFVHGSIRHTDSSPNNYFRTGRKLYHTGNTTVSGGNLRPSSPVLHLFQDKVQEDKPEEYKEFQNLEFNKVSTGYYELKNVPELRESDGWYLDQPLDRNNNTYHNVDWFYNKDTKTLTVKTFKKQWNKETGVYDNGSLIDIHKNRSITLRFIDIPELYPDEEI